MEGLNTAGILKAALELDTSDDPANVLMERLSSVEAQMLAAAAAEASSPVLSPQRSVESLKRLRLERERAGVQRDIDQLQAAGDTGSRLTELLERKLSIQRALESMAEGEITSRQGR